LRIPFKISNLFLDSHAQWDDTLFANYQHTKSLFIVFGLGFNHSSISVLKAAKIQLHADSSLSKNSPEQMQIRWLFTWRGFSFTNCVESVTCGFISMASYVVKSCWRTAEKIEQVLIWFTLKRRS